MLGWTAAPQVKHLCDAIVSLAPGDYWPGEAENLLLGIAEEARQAGKRAGKGAGSKANPAGRGGKKVRTHAVAGDWTDARRWLLFFIPRTPQRSLQCRADHAPMRSPAVLVPKRPAATTSL